MVRINHSGLRLEPCGWQPCTVLTERERVCCYTLMGKSVHRVWLEEADHVCPGHTERRVTWAGRSQGGTLAAVASDTVDARGLMGFGDGHGRQDGGDRPVPASTCLPWVDPRR
jgi:hypothetical protein